MKNNMIVALIDKVSFIKCKLFSIKISKVFNIVFLAAFSLSQICGAPGSEYDAYKPTEFFMPKDIIDERDVLGLPEDKSSSYWDKTISLNQDYIILGAGIVGLSTAIEVKKMEPSARVLVLERGTLASGASTRNAGFACFGSLTEINEDISIMGAEKAVSQVRDRWSGLNDLRNTLGDEAISFRQTGNYELISPDLLPLVSRIKEINELLYPIFNSEVFSRVDEKISQFGFSKKHVAALIFNKFEGQINSGMMMESLQKKAQSLGVVIRYGSEALRPYWNEGSLHVPVKVNIDSKINTHFKARAVAVCTNGFISELIPEIQIKPGRGQILVTSPVLDTSLPNVPFHMGKGFWYFRLLDDNRILLGGGRNLNMLGETTSQLSITSDIMGPLRKILSSIITPGTEHSVDFSWSGIMGFSEDHSPIIRRVPGLYNVVVGFGCNGMGVARGYDTGKKTALLLLEK